MSNRCVRLLGTVVTGLLAVTIVPAKAQAVSASVSLDLLEAPVQDGSHQHMGVFLLTLRNNSSKMLHLVVTPGATDATHSCSASIIDLQNGIELKERELAKVHSSVGYELAGNAILMRRYATGARFAFKHLGAYSIKVRCYYLEDGEEHSVDSKTLDFELDNLPDR